MSFLLDTCFLSEFVKKYPDPKVVAWSGQQPESAFHISVLTLGELQQGITQMVASKRKTALEKWFGGELLSRFEGRVLPITDVVAVTWGEIQGEARLKGKPLSAVDSLLAATALIYDLTLVTRNVVDMQGSGARLINPWK
ncbi:MAG: type II toxin-antitoxin system VapC family toxin [Gemmatimonadetes bacterium]|nr:type II toxin-antitoxin system VapC family toxin [Gemmatimonadota bacterium]